MARPQKLGMDYFPLDCGFFSNRKIKALRRAHGTLGILTYLNILCKVYDHGYYLKIESLDEFAYDIAEEIANDRLATVASRVTDCVHYLAELELLDARLLAGGVISGRAIQEQYKLSCEKMKRAAQIREYALIDSAFVVEETHVNSEETTVNSEETPINSEIMQQSKGKENSNLDTISFSQSINVSKQEDETDGRAEKEFYIECIKTRLDTLDDPYKEDYSERLENVVAELQRHDVIKVNGIDVPTTEILKSVLDLFRDPEQLRNALFAGCKSGIKRKFNYTVAALYNAARGF